MLYFLVAIILVNSITWALINYNTVQLYLLYLKSHFYVSIPATTISHVPLPFTKQTCCTTILKRMQSTSLEYNIEH